MHINGILKCIEHKFGTDSWTEFYNHVAEGKCENFKTLGLHGPLSITWKNVSPYGFINAKRQDERRACLKPI